jgi:hypothetical protein
MRLNYIQKQLRDLINRLSIAGYHASLVKVTSNKETTLVCDFDEDASGELFSLPVSSIHKEEDDNVIPKGYEAYGIYAYKSLWVVDEDEDGGFMWASAPEENWKRAGINIQHLR